MSNSTVVGPVMAAAAALVVSVSAIVVYHKVFAVRVATVDVPQVINLAKEQYAKQLIERTKTQQPIGEKETDAFLAKLASDLDGALREISTNCRCVLMLKQAVLGGEDDLTAQLRRRLNL